jgi:uncharacterized protein (DUF1330 family)
MTIYAIARIDVTDKEGFRRYAQEVPATLAKYGGRYLVQGGPFEVIEGEWKPRLLVVVEFPSRERLEAWYNSEEYKPLLELRKRSAKTDAVIAEGK